MAASQTAGAADPLAQAEARAQAQAQAKAQAQARAQAWADALQAANLLAVDPAGIGGVRLRGAADALREQWLVQLRAALPEGAPLARMPLHIDDDRLLGGLDLGATVRSGRAVAQPGLLTRCDGGVLLVAMAERLSAATAARLCGAIDTRQVALQRAGLATVSPVRIGVVALDEGLAEDEVVPPALLERLGVVIDLRALAAARETRHAHPPAAGKVAAARARLAGVRAPDAIVQVLCEAAEALGVDSLRAPIFALRLARAAAAWAGRDEVQGEDAALAARLVLAPRATRLPPQPEEPAEDEPPPPDEPPPEPPEPPDEPPQQEDAEPQELEDQPLEDRVLQAAMAAIPPGLLAMLLAGGLGRTQASGRAGAVQASKLRGRPAGSRKGEPKAGSRLHLIDTLRAAAPWQGIRRREREAAGLGADTGPRVHVRREDFHITRYRHRRETTTIFVVDASGSAALHRLAEAKGAVELLLADCYVRRDRVALIAFRAVAGMPGAELLLPPTRSLVRTKRCLAALPGGGGTPLAAGLDAARTLAEDVLRRGGTPLVVLLTDGRANIARDGSPGRPKALEDALASARLWRERGIGAVLLDTSPQPQAQAQHIALTMGARYLPLPHADAQRMSQAVRAVTPA